MERVTIGDAFHRRDRASLDFRRQDEARGHQSIIEQHRAGTAVAGAAAFLGPRQAERVAQRGE